MKLSIGKAWDETSAFLMREGRLVAPVALALFALPSTLINWAYPGGTIGSAPGGTLIMLLILIAVMIGQMTIVLLAIGWSGSIGQAIGKVARRVPSLIGAAIILFGPILLLFMFAVASILVAAGVKDPSAITPQELARLPNIGWMSLVLVAALVFVGVKMFPLSAVAANETLGPIKMIKRCWALTKGNFARLLAMLLALSLAALVLSSAVSWVVGSIATLTIGDLRPFNLSALLVALAGGIVTAMVSSVSAAMVGRIYTQLAGEQTAVAA